MIRVGGALPSEQRLAMGVHGLRLFLLSLAILFGSSLIGYLFVRFLPSEEPMEIPPLPRALWGSTLMLVASSGTMQLALVSARRGRPDTVRRAMTATLLLAIGFLAIQGLCWYLWAGPLTDHLAETQRRFALAGFYVLTGLHAAHVIGGLIPMSIVTFNAFHGRYTPEDHAGVLYCATYWHFLDGVWLVLFATLLV
jgi:cytochrome c oxidase subunit 3